MTTNRTLTASVIAAEAVMILDNNLVMANQVFREYESEYSKSINGYKPGATITIRRPTDFTVRDGATYLGQNVDEGSTTIVVNKQKGVDFEFTSTELSLSIGDLSKRVIKPAMVQIANQVDFDIMALYASVPNWVGTPGQTINSFADFAVATQRMDESAVPLDDRSAVLSPADHWGLLSNQTGLFIQDAARGAYREGSLGKVGGVDIYMAQNVPTHTTGARDDTTPITRAAGGTGLLVSTWALSKDTNTMILSTQGWDSSTTLKAGDVITIATVFAVNPVTKATLPFLKQFVVVSDVTADATTTNQTLVTISPAPISSGAFQNVSTAPIAGLAIVNVGTASTGYRQNMVFHRNAFALAMVPMDRPAGAVDVARKSYKGLSVRVIPFYDGANDISKWRLDVLYGVKAIDPRLAVRLSGTP